MSNPPPPPRVGWDFVGALGSIELVPLLSFFCCRFRVTCLFMVCLHVIAYHVCMPHAHKGARMTDMNWTDMMVAHLCEKLGLLYCMSQLGMWAGGWVSEPPPPPRGGCDICRSVGMPKFWVGGSLNQPPPPP